MSAEIRSFDVAQHEAAHVVVGVALGLRLHRAGIERIQDGPWTLDGHATFTIDNGVRRREALGLMYAAGIAWDQCAGNPRWWSDADRCELRKVSSGRHGVETQIRAAGALLIGLTRQHAQVTRALLERDLTGADIAALCRGEWPGD